MKRNKWQSIPWFTKKKKTKEQLTFYQHSSEYKISWDNWTKWIFMTLWQVCSVSTLIIIFSSWNLCPKSKQLRLSSRLPSLPSGISARCLSHKSFCYNTKHYFLQIWIISKWHFQNLFFFQDDSEWLIFWRENSNILAIIV